MGVWVRSRAYTHANINKYIHTYTHSRVQAARAKYAEARSAWQHAQRSSKSPNKERAQHKHTDRGMGMGRSSSPVKLKEKGGMIPGNVKPKSDGGKTPDAHHEVIHASAPPCPC